MPSPATRSGSPDASRAPPDRAVAGFGNWGYIGFEVVELTVVGVRVELPANQPIVLLREQGGERYLPIWIGAAEATAIALAMQGVTPPRPMTHDLFKNVLEELQVQVDRIEITELREGTFYSVISMTRNGTKHEVSSRPSDAIALAVRSGVPIFAEEAVLGEASVVIRDDEEQEVERFKQFLEDVSPEDFMEGS